jgi:hypothetical protein
MIRRCGVSEKRRGYRVEYTCRLMGWNRVGRRCGGGVESSRRCSHGCGARGVLTFVISDGSRMSPVYGVDLLCFHVLWRYICKNRNGQGAASRRVVTYCDGAGWVIC